MTSGRRHIMLGTAGHVDHGKTALVKLLTGCDTDRLADEKQRGLTIELGFAPCAMADERIVGIVDVPGHVDFIRNMVAGAHGVNVVIFVVAADDGVMPQTREHLDILTLTGCDRGLVALTKIDTVDSELRALAIDEVRQFVQGTFLQQAPICPVSNITGEGFDRLFSALNEQVNQAADRPADGCFRMWIERAFRIAGFGAVASGIPTAGTVGEGDRLELLPGGQSVRVRKLQVYGQDSQTGQGGECVALNVADVDFDALSRGKVLAQTGVFEAATYVEADLRLLDRATRPLEDYAEVHVHAGTAELMANVAMLDGRPIEPGQSKLVQLRLREPSALAAGDRFVIRGSLAGLAGGRVTTLGGGRILSTSDIKLRRNRPWTLEGLADLRDALDDADAWVEMHARQAGGPVGIDALARAAQLPCERVGQIAAALARAGRLRALGEGRWVHPRTVADLGRRIIEALDTFHSEHPRRLGLSADALAERTEAEPALLAMAIDEQLDADAVERRGQMLARPGRGAQLSAEELDLARRAETALRQAGLEPPLPGDLADRLNASPDRLSAALALLADEGKVLSLDRKVTLHVEAITRAQQVVLDLFAQAKAFTTTEFRDALGVSRKYAIPLLDYLDRARWTVRSGNRRTPGAEAKRRLAPPETS